MSRRWKIALCIAGGAAAAIVAVLIVASVEISRHAREWMSEVLTQQFNGDVELSSFRVAVPFPLVQIEGENLALRFQGRQDLPPMIAVKQFTVRASVWGLLRIPHHVQYVQLQGLQITIPPREERAGGGKAKEMMRKFHMISFDQVLSENATLKILTTKPGKNPLEFDIQPLLLHSVGSDGTMVFRATLSNPTPPGEIVSAGTLGPWNADTPSMTPVSGTYTFDKADLGVFRGIAGILSSKGDYHGVLEEIQTDGTTDTPDFRVTRAGHPVHLTTTFQATVDGTDGDTYLHPVEAHFGQTVLLAQGKVEGALGKKGKTITVDVSADQGRIEDLLQLAVKQPAPMAGPIRLKTKLILAPGPKEIFDRLKVDGSFVLDSVHFTNSTVQQKVDNVSKRALGEPKEVQNPQNPIGTDDVASNMKDSFRLENGVLTLSGLTFSVPGANVELAGTCALEPETLDLHGKIEMQAKLSQATTGAASFLLKFADPFFSKKGKGTVLPIKIVGPFQHPSYGLDLHHKSKIENANK